MDELPVYDESSEMGDLGVNIVSGRIIKEFSWIFREQAKNDLGIDAHIQLTDEDRKSSGRIIAAQIKTGPSFFQEPTDEGFIFRGDKKHLRYWLNHSLPVIVVLCDPATEICYWVEVTRVNATELEKGWKIVVPKSQTVSQPCRRKLVQIAGSPQHPDIVELLMFKFLQEKYHKYSGHRIDICPLMDEPRDFHYLTCLAEITGLEGYVYVAHFYDLYRDFTLEDVHRFISWRDLNMQSCGHTDILPNLFILLISERKEKLSVSPEIQAVISGTEKVMLLRLLYQSIPFIGQRRFYSLIEIDENGEEIYGY